MASINILYWLTRRIKSLLRRFDAAPHAIRGRRSERLWPLQLTQGKGSCKFFATRMSGVMPAKADCFLSDAPAISSNTSGQRRVVDAAT